MCQGAISAAPTAADDSDACAGGGSGADCGVVRQASKETMAAAWWLA